MTDPDRRVEQLTEANAALQRQVAAQAGELANAARSRENYRHRAERDLAERDRLRTRLDIAQAAYLEEANRLVQVQAEVEALRAQERMMSERDRNTGRLLSEAYRRGWGDGAAAMQKRLQELAGSVALPAPGDRPQHACTCIRTPQLPDHRASNAACNLTRYHRAMEGRAMT